MLSVLVDDGFGEEQLVVVFLKTDE